MTPKQKRARRSVIIAELSRMSRDWSKYTATDWQPLEKELQELEDERG
jgi:hypothetical protein